MDRKKGKDNKNKKLNNNKSKKVVEPEKTPEVPEPEILFDSDEEEEPILSAASIVAYSECTGFDSISEDIAASLAEDATYRLREVIHNCAVLMKNQKHKKLYVSDLNDVLEAYESPTLYGHAHFPDEGWQYVKAAGVFVPQTEVVDLVSVATSSKSFYQNKDPIIKGSWILPESSEVINEVDLNSDCEETDENVPPLIADTGHESFIVKNDEKISSRIDSRLPPHAQKYCLHLAKIIIRGHEPFLKIVLQDIRTNPRVSALSPYLLNLVTLSINMLDRRASLTHALLRVVEALVQNPCVNPSYSHSIKRVVNALLVVAIEPHVMTDCDDLLLRKRASLLLRNVLESWLVELKQQNDIIKILEGVLCPNISLASHYGALVLLTVLGYCAKIYFFYGILKRYLPILSEIEAQDTVNCAVEVNHIKGALLLAAESMYRRDLSVHRPIEEWKYRQKIDEMLYSYLGDSLCLRRLCSPLINGSSHQLIFPSVNRFVEGDDILAKEKGSDASPAEFTFFKNAVTRSSKLLAKKYKPVSTFLLKYPPKKNRKLTPELVFDNFKLLAPNRSRIVFNFIGSSQIPFERMKRRPLSISHPIYDPSKYKFSRCKVGKETRKIKFCMPFFKKSCAGDLYPCI